MIKTDLKVKQNISLTDRISVTNIIADSYFTEDESGTINFTPYFSNMSTITCFAEYFLEGVEFEDDEKMYDAVINDKEIYQLYKDFQHSNETYWAIADDVNEMVDFRKQQMIHNKKSSLDNLLDTINEVVTSMKDNLKMDELLPLMKQLGAMGNLNESKLVEAVVKSLPQDHKKKRKPKAKNPDIVPVEKVEE